MPPIKIISLLALWIGGLTLLPLSLAGQSTRSLEEEARRLYAKGDFHQAARLWERLFQEKSRSEYAYEAAGSYQIARDYRAALSLYRRLLGETSKFPMMLYQYARALKQDGQYDLAVKSYNRFLEGYLGADKGLWGELVDLEIEGCRLGLQLSGTPDDRLILERPQALNTPRNEFAAASPEPGSIFYTSDAAGRDGILASVQSGVTWEKGKTPPAFPLFPQGKISHGSFTADGTQFYFTLCSQDARPRCEIYRMRRTGSSWSQPVRLPDAINAPGQTATHPHAVTRNGREILYFASDRPGGRGGLDLWFVSRDANHDDATYLPPVNAGPGVNSAGDEVSPFYHLAGSTLYFSSNGHPSIGGFDIFASTGTMTHWGTVRNMGVPCNSPADDLHFTLSPDQTYGWLSSNRIFENGKTETSDMDLFHFMVRPESLKIGVTVTDDQGKPLQAFTLKLFEETDGGRLLTFSREYRQLAMLTLDLLPSRSFLLSLQAPGYLPGEVAFASPDSGGKISPVTITLKPLPRNAPEKPAELPVPEKPVKVSLAEKPASIAGPNIPEKPQTIPQDSGEGEGETTYRVRGISSFDNAEYSSAAPRLPGITYKVQVEATDRFRPERYRDLEDLGSLQTEYLTEKKLYRILLGTFTSTEPARSARSEAIARGFSGAFLVKYTEGVRVGMTAK